MSANKTKNKYKIQISLQLIIILSLVAIVALISASLYLSSAHKVSIASFGDIISAQASSSNTLVLKLTEPLPSGTQIESINFTGIPSGTSISVSLENQTPVYSNGYPEYSFSVSGLPEPLPYYNVTSLTYEVNGKTVSVPTITGEPMAIVETSLYSSNSNIFPQPASIPSGIVAYVPITITNTQDISTQKPFQQMIQLQESQFSNYIAYNGNVANFEFFTQKGQVLPAWIESNTSGDLIIWVKIPGIPAKHSETIYLGFASQKTNLLSSSGTTGIGEAPQLSCPNPDNTANCQTYAQYDDGSSVFNNYWNWVGTSIPSEWAYTCLFGCGGSVNGVSQNNGLTIILYGIYQRTDFAISQTFVPPVVFDWYGTPYTPSSGSEGTTSNTGGWGFGMWAPGLGGNVQNPSIGMGSFGIGTSNYYLDGDPSLPATWAVDPPNKGVYTVVDANTAVGMLNYTNSVSQEITPSSYNIGWIYGGGTSNGIVTVQWARIRSYPPNGVMPSVNIGSVQQTS